MRPGQQLHDSEAADRAGRGRLLRYCARAPFTLDRPRDPERLLYESTKARPEQERFAAPRRRWNSQTASLLGAAAARPPSSLLRRVDANGRSREIPAAIPNGSTWPILLKNAGDDRIWDSVRCLILQCFEGALQDDGTTSRRTGAIVLFV
jgi:hypothetical protein